MIGVPLKVSELIDEVARGGIQLPEIQRAYVWKGPQVARLLDSLYRDYPAGQIMLWDTELAPPVRSLKGVAAKDPGPGVRAKIVLDGQQRLTSLVLALAQEDLLDAGRVRVYFNVQTEAFERRSSKMNADPRWVSVRDVVQGVADDLEIMDKIHAAGGPDIRSEEGKIYRARLARLRALRDYKFPIELFRSDDYETVTDLFVRINSGGTRLRQAELVLAQLALRLPGAVQEQFEAAIEEYEDAGFALDARFLVRALVVVGTGQPRFRHLSDFWKRDPAEINALWKKTRKGIDSTVNFVRANVGFDTSDWLPSLYPLILLTALFADRARLSETESAGLRRWFFIASLRGRYSTSGETALDEDLKSLPGGPTALIANVTGPAGWAPVSPDEFDDAGTSNALFSLTYAAARARGAADWFKNIEIASDALGADHDLHVHHIFPKALLRAAGVRRPDIDEIANLAFLAAKPNKSIGKKPPAQYLAEIAQRAPAALTAQCIPLNPKLWEIDRFQDFLAERRTLLAAAVNDLAAS
jgi:hypothetical protein